MTFVQEEPIAVGETVLLETAGSAFDARRCSASDAPNPNLSKSLSHE
jgi:hypothetical protein